MTSVCGVTSKGSRRFNSFIRTSLQTNKPYNQMAKELIRATGTNSYQQGELNFNVAGVMGGGPLQDVFDLQAANVAEKSLGMAHLNCLLCHNGRGPPGFDQLVGLLQDPQRSVRAWRPLCRTRRRCRIPVDLAVPNGQNYWAQQNNLAVGTMRGRGSEPNQLHGGLFAEHTDGQSPTAWTCWHCDARSTFLHHEWRAACGRLGLSRVPRRSGHLGLPVLSRHRQLRFGNITSASASSRRRNQFDPFRLDPSNPPKDCPLTSSPCTLQPSHPELLNALAQDFIDSGYNLKALMKQITNSRAYQLVLPL